MVRVVVIGAGIIGICSAYQIKDKFPHCDVTIIADKFTPNNTSDGAAGLMRSAKVGNTPRELIRKWSEGTRKHMLKLLEKADAPKMGVSIVHGYLLTEKDVTKSEWEEEAANCHLLTEVDLQGFPERIKGGCSYSAVMIEGAIFIPYFTKQFIEKGGKILQQRVTDIKELFNDFDIVINCCGLGAHELVNDKDVHPVRGQVIRVRAPWIKEFIYHVDVDKEGRVIYIFPNQDTVVLGGTKQIYNVDLKAQLEEREWILKATQEFIPSLKHAQFVCDWVGLRPGRTSVRLERENMDITVNGCSKTGIVIHNYGHGANGITLSWGCGENVVELFEEYLKENNLKLHSKI